MDAANVTDQVRARMEVLIKAFEEDRTIIEAQQKIWNLTDAKTKRVFLPQDKGPTMIRKLMASLIRQQ